MALLSTKTIVKYKRAAMPLLVISFFAIVFLNINQTAAALSLSNDILANQPDTGEWSIPAGTDVVLKRWRTKITDATITTSNHFKVDINKDNYRVNIKGMENAYDNNTTDLGRGKSIRYDKSISAGYDSRKYDSNWKVISDDLKDAYITLFFSDAAEDLEGRKYDIEIKMTNIRVVMKKGSGTASRGVALVYGDNTIGYGLHFGSFGYKGDGGEAMGASFDFAVKLYHKGTSNLIDSSKRMVWKFDDIDISDKISGGLYENGNHWAENVKLISGFIAPIYLSKNHELHIDLENNNKEIRFSHTKDEDNDNKKTSIMFIIDPSGFKFSWGGSRCATDFVVPAGTLYDATTSIKVDGSAKSNDSSITVSGDNHTVNFSHSITRKDSNDTEESEKYYLNSGVNTTWSTIVSTTTLTKFKKGETRESPKNNAAISAKLSPGDSKTYWQTLHFQRSNIKSDFYVIYGKSCTIGGQKISGRHCVHLSRPPATFTGSVAAKVKLNGSNFVNPVNETTTPAGNKVTTSNGSYSVRFTNTIKRNSDGSGGDVEMWWFSTMRQGSTSGTAISGKRIPATGANSITLAEGNSSTVIKESDGYTYTGTLKYGETKVICDVLTYNDTRSTALANGGKNSDAHKCVKVYRDPKPCDINTSVKFGIHNGENLGRIGAVNASLGGSFTYSNANPNAFSSSNNYTQRANPVWARPGDSIKFEHGGCAGGQYAASNSNLNANTYKTTYTFSGNLRQYTSPTQIATVNANDYLFGEKVSNKRQNSPLKYHGTVNRSSTDTGNAFPVGDNVELNEQSPSNTNNHTYARDTYNDKSYSCLTLNENAPFRSNHYQIAGVNSTNNTSCHAYSKTTVASDVGRIITQRLNWNYLKVENDKLSTSGRNTKLTAEANVMVPYNYNAQPYISGPNTNVIYRGSSMGVDLKVFVTPRKNSAFGTGNTEQAKALNTYATITKPTTVTAEYYYRSRNNFNSKYGETTISGANYHNRLNQNGAFNGNADDSSSLSNGGSTVGSFSIPVPDSLQIGDKVCVGLTVSPADSHNAFQALTVNGAGSNNAALMESGTSSKTAEFCRTVAKLPTMSVEGSNAFTGDTSTNGYGFNTSRFSKTFDNSGTSYMFGSWSEYGVYGKVTVNNNHGFASGATFGYQTGNDGNITINKARDNSGEVAKSGAAHSSTCVYSTQTFVNANCSSNDVGKAGIGENAARQFRERIEDRFTSGSSPWIRESEYGNDCVTDNYYHTHKCIKAKGDHTDNAYHKYADYDVYMNNNRDAEGNYIRDENGMIHVRIDGDAYFGSATSANSTKLDMVMNHNFWSDTETFNWTYVYEIDGTFVLDGDIKVGDIRNGGNNYRDDPVMQRLGNVRVPIISVDKLHLTNRVTRIDAIILANEIDTCAYNSYADFVSGNKIKADRSNLSADVCNNTVEFRAPVYTKKLILNRTAGSESGSNTIQRAEIFDMNMATYLWSYNQMSRYSQAVTVEQKELPSRY